MKTRTYFLLAYTFAIAFGSVQAATPLPKKLSFVPDGSVVSGGERDPLLKVADINAAVLSGIRSQGITLNDERISTPSVTFSYSTLYSSQAENFRSVSGTFEVMENSPLSRMPNGAVATCSVRFHTWRAGHSVERAVQGILDDLRRQSVEFVKICFK